MCLRQHLERNLSVCERPNRSNCLTERSPRNVHIRNFEFPFSLFQPLALSPVLPSQSPHSSKFLCIRRDQCQSSSPGLPRGQRVVRPDGSAHSLQSVSDFSGAPPVFFPEFQHSHWTFKKHLKAPGIRFGLDALHHSVPKLKHGHSVPPPPFRLAPRLPLFLRANLISTLAKFSP
jgi:hypothetical protein